jgi:TatA/E family protein of Tat protein translocase
MEIFGVGPAELLIILVIALIVFGPGKLPEIGAAVGKAIGDFRRTAREMTGDLQGDLESVKDELEGTMEGVKKDVTDTVNVAQEQVNSIGQATQQAIDSANLSEEEARALEAERKWQQLGSASEGEEKAG